MLFLCGDGSRCKMGSPNLQEFATGVHTRKICINAAVGHYDL
jgi:hypothetical protein